MGGSGGFFGSPASTLQAPTPVQLFPGAQGLGQSLINYFNNLLTGSRATTPYKGYSSVYGTSTPTLNVGNQMDVNPTFPGTTAPASGSGAASTPSTPNQPSFQDLINAAVQQAVAGGAPPVTAASTRDAGGGAS